MTPEKQVEQSVRFWLMKNNFSVEVFDAKATFSKAHNMYKKSQSMKEGVSDLVGVSPQGYFVAVELKAPKKEKVCRLKQYHYLRAKIASNGFGLVVSDVSFLSETWKSWLNLRLENKEKEARDFLLSLLPKKVQVGKRIVMIENFT